MTAAEFHGLARSIADGVVGLATGLALLLPAVALAELRHRWRDWRRDRYHRVVRLNLSRCRGNRRRAS